MNKLLTIIFMSSYLMATFSIVAVDTTTGEVGSAGGSCIAGSIIISDNHPGVGAIHTQAYYLSSNQNYASSLMDEGYSPSEIIALLEENDVQNNPSIRQYGAVDLFNGNNTREHHSLYAQLDKKKARINLSFGTYILDKVLFPSLDI